MLPKLESITQSIPYGDLPETWRVPDTDRFSLAKTLYDYQADALRNAARALYLYYGKDGNDWSAGEVQQANDERKKSFSGLYGDTSIPSVRKYKTPVDRKNEKQNPVFRILGPYIRPFGEEIPYQNLINRMCFWMATGSGKTLVIVKLIEYLHCLIKHREIPPHNMLILAPSEHLLGQIKRTVEEFNQTGLHIDLVPLRDIHRTRQGRLGDVVTVYYHRSDNISDVQKEALTDYRTYENDGKWYVLLDEAHKGSKKDNSKRQAYYAVLARKGFLFNFSATFTEVEDVVTTVKKYNLENFVRKGHGKNIYLNMGEYEAFKKRDAEISHDERRQIVLKSLITLSHVSLRVKKLRASTQLDNLYHLPLMLTLVNSVNTDIENKQNDLWAFFQTLREIATGEIDKTLFKDAKTELAADWRRANLLFQEDGGGIMGTDQTSVTDMSVADLREAIFLSRRKGALQVVLGKDRKELAFQVKSADAPFALIRIGDTSKWRNQLLAGYEETASLQEKSFFDELEKSSITILMGSRSFFESWDSNRPNVINFINIGGTDAKKFVVQSVGRGVRIEPLPGKRRRFSFLAAELDEKQKTLIEHSGLSVQPPETLFLFATNRKAVQAVLEGLEGEKREAFEPLEGFESAPVPTIGRKKMLLLIPQYKELKQGTNKHPFSMNQETLERFKAWLKQTSDAVFAVRDGLAVSQIEGLRHAMAGTSAVKNNREKNYAMLSFLQQRFLSHLASSEKVSDGIRKMDAENDIVHFRQISVRSEYFRELQEKIHQVREGKSKFTKKELAGQFASGEITEDQFDRKSTGQDEDTCKDLIIKKIVNHYYLPLVLGDEKADYIRHIIKIKSEINFLGELEKWLKKNKPKWDGWMFSKIDEYSDKVHIPYYDDNKNEYRRFLPDFVFWMCRGNEYRIVFVDPKGDAYTRAYRKIDGYQKLFYENEKARQFSYGKYKVSVNLLYYNPDARPPDAYRSFWIADPASIFTD